MSQIAISPPATGTGVFTISAPATNTNRTLTLPDNSGTVLNENSNIEAQVKTATNATGTAPIYAARAWVNFNGTGTVAIRASGNVSSITDNGIGDYTVNFTTAMPDANYAVCGTSSWPSVGAEGEVVLANNFTSAPTTMLARIANGIPGTNGSTALTVRDSAFVNVSIFR